MSDELWDQFREACEWRGESASAVIRRNMEMFVCATDRERQDQEADRREYAAAFAALDAGPRSVPTRRSAPVLRMLVAWHKAAGIALAEYGALDLVGAVRGDGEVEVPLAERDLLEGVTVWGGADAGSGARSSTSTGRQRVEGDRDSDRDKPRAGARRGRPRGSSSSNQTPANASDDGGKRVLLNHRAAAMFLGVSGQTLRRWRDNDMVPFVRLGDRVIRYDRKELRKLLDQQARGKRQRGKKKTASGG